MFSGLFVVLAAGMFGMFDLQMPSAIQSRLANVSSSQRSGTAIGAFVMGALSSLVVTACVAPALIAALTVMAQTGDMVRGGMALFAMSLGMGAPLLAVGAAQGKLLPKAGAVDGRSQECIRLHDAWAGHLDDVTRNAGRGHAGAVGHPDIHVWCLHGRPDNTDSRVSWHAEIRQRGRSAGRHLRRRTACRLTRRQQQSVASPGSTERWRRWRNSGSGGTPGPGIPTNQDHGDLDAAVAQAASSGKSAMLDFYADWCVSCIEMEEYTFTDSDVQVALANTVLLQADVTANDDEDQALLKRFGVFGPPTIIFFGTDGVQRHGYEVVGYMKAKDFAHHVRMATGNAASLSANNQ